MEEKTTLTIYERMGDPLTAIIALGKSFATSGLLGIKTPEQGQVVALTCMIEKITPLEFARTYDIIEGKPYKKAAAMQAEFLAHGGRIQFHEYSDFACEATFSHSQLCPQGIKIKTTFEELKSRGVSVANDGHLKANYKKHPRQMLKARVVAEGIRLIDPAINAGIYSAEELDDEAKSVTIEKIEYKEIPKIAESVVTAEKISELVTEKKYMELNEKVKNILTAFNKFGITLDDLQRFCGNFENQILAEDWTEKQFNDLRTLYKEIEALPLEERKEEIARRFAF